MLIKLKLIALIAIWSLICLGLYGVIALGEAVLEVGADAATGQASGGSGLIDLLGDIVQWGVGLVWLAGVLALWFVKRLLTSRETRAATANLAVRTAATAAPFVIARHPLGKAVNVARGPAGKLLAGLLARKLTKR
jgi:hypothetical protein